MILIVRILIVYDTKRGSTKKVATFMSNVLSKISDVEISKPSEKNVQSYDAVVILSSIYYEKPLNSIISFIHTNRKALSGIPVCLGAVCMAQMFGHTAKNYAYKYYLVKMEEALGREPECRGIITGFLFKQRSRTSQDAIDLAKRFCKILNMDNVK